MTETRISIRIDHKKLLLSNKLNGIIGEVEIDKNKATEIIKKYGKYCRVILDNAGIEYEEMKQMIKYNVLLEIIGSAWIKHKNSSGAKINIEIVTDKKEYVTLNKRLEAEIHKDMHRGVTKVPEDIRSNERNIMYIVNRSNSDGTIVECTSIMSEDEVDRIHKEAYSKFKVLEKISREYNLYAVRRIFEC